MDIQSTKAYRDVALGRRVAKGEVLKNIPDARGQHLIGIGYAVEVQSEGRNSRKNKDHGGDEADGGTNEFGSNSAEADTHSD